MITRKAVTVIAMKCGVLTSADVPVWIERTKLLLPVHPGALLTLATMKNFVRRLQENERNPKPIKPFVFVTTEDVDHVDAVKALPLPPYP